MEPLELADLPDGALLLVDSPPIIYFLEGHPQFAERFRPLFEAHAAGEVRFAVTTITIAEVLIGPLCGPPTRRLRGAIVRSSKAGGR